MKQVLKEIADRSPGWVELRYHRRLQNRFTVQKGRVDAADSSVNAGVGVRVLESGSWGFASTADTERGAIEKAVEQARASAMEGAKLRREKIAPLPATELATEDVVLEGYEELSNKALDEKLEAVLEMEKATKVRSDQIHTVSSSYTEMFEEKVIVTSDGAAASQKLVRPELRLAAFASGEGDHNVGHNSLGVTGGWQCLFDHHRAQGIVEQTARQAVELLGAPHVAGGKATVILEPSIVGLLSHEAIGHTVEADFVQSGSVAAGKIGQEVASELVTLCDAGGMEHGGFPGGAIPFDDEGVPAGKTTVIERGKLVSYLHNRESAAAFGVAPTGNGRAWLYSDEPLIRMTNTYIEPGRQSLEEIIASTEQGYLIVGAGSGQADATGEFMFGSDYAVEIIDGKLGRKFKEVTISGIAFDVLKTVDAVSSEFKWDLGSGYCGKWQPAKVDAGGPYLRCQLTLGGRQ
jgi:TldD protein